MATQQPSKAKSSPDKLQPATKKKGDDKVAGNKAAAEKVEHIKASSEKKIKKVSPAAKPAAKASELKKNAVPASKLKTPVKKAPIEQSSKTSQATVKSSASPKSSSTASKEASSKSAALQKTATSQKTAPTKPATEPKHTDTDVKTSGEGASTYGIAPVNGAKQVIVPVKPAINPKQQLEKKPEPSKSNKPVVIPKTTTDKVVDYEPDFTKSVLDTPAQAPILPTMRYSDVELNEFKELINKKLDAAKKELVYLQGLITRKDEMGGDESDNRYMTMEDGSMSMEREQLSQMASRQITFIDHLEKALMRIENKTYGICRVTGKLIDKARLRAVPHATLSMEAKLGIVK